MTHATDGAGKRRAAGATIVLVVLGLAPSSPLLAQVLRPVKDGTLADGGLFGPFDGLADDSDWYFNQTSYEGSISLSRNALPAGLEHRVVWEYDLRAITLTPPVKATLRAVVRGAAAFPRPPADVHVYAYPADLQETLSDFSAAPIGLQGVLTLNPYQPPTAFTVDVSAVVSAALASGTDMVAFRFQIDPNSTHVTDQAFIDALDSDTSTKPSLTLEVAPVQPGDTNGDGVVDVDDYILCGPCLLGPNVPIAPACAPCDLDDDQDVDLRDHGIFQTLLPVSVQ